MKNIKSYKDFLSVNEASLSDDIKKNFEEIKKAVSKANSLLNLKVNSNDDELFMIEIAMAETKLGTDTNSLRTSGNGGKGAWQLDKVGFESTKDKGSHPNVLTYMKTLKKSGIDWKSITWDKCNELLYGAIAARIFLLNKPFEIAHTIEERAKQWKEHYNSTSGAGSDKEYVERVAKCKEMLGIHDVLPGISTPKNSSEMGEVKSGLVNFISNKGKKTVLKKKTDETKLNKPSLTSFFNKSR